MTFAILTDVTPNYGNVVEVSTSIDKIEAIHQRWYCINNISLGCLVVVPGGTKVGQRIHLDIVR